MADFYVAFVLPDGKEINVDGAGVPSVGASVHMDHWGNHRVTEVNWYVHTYPDGGKLPTAAAEVILEAD